MRREDWPERLSAVLEAAQTREFCYGEHDCCTHAADVVEALTGRDVAADWRGRYSTPTGGLALAGVRRLDGLPRKVGLKPVAPALAHRGDIAMALVGAPARGRRRPTPMLMVIDGAKLRGPAGAVVPRALAVKAWSVA